MIRLVLGGIALAAVGYKVLEYCDEEGCPWDVPVSESKQKDDVLFSGLSAVLKNIDEGKQKVTLLLEHGVADEQKNDLLLCFKVLEDAYEVGNFYARNVKKKSDVETLTGVEKKMHLYASDFCTTTESLLSLKVVDAEGSMEVATLKAFLLYKEALGKHKTKISFFKCGKENYSLFLTGFEKGV